MHKKPLKINVLLLFLFIFCSNCQKNVKNCEILPDLEQIGESAKENIENLRETNLKAAKLRCNF
jgi:hypothetical protein